MAEDIVEGQHVIDKGGEVCSLSLKVEISWQKKKAKKIGSGFLSEV